MRTAMRLRQEQQIDERKRLKPAQQISSVVDFDAAQGTSSQNSKHGISTATILHMQQTQGNAAVRRMLTQQPQLSIVQRDDDDDDDANQSVIEAQDSQPEDNPSVEQPESDNSELVEQAESVDSQPNDTEPQDSSDDQSDNENGGVDATGECSIEPQGEELAAEGKGCTKVSLHGLTLPGYDHGKPRPPTLPGNAITSKVDKNKTKASGTLTVTYTANPKITLPKPPDNCSDCQKAAAQTFIDTTLTTHEQDHVKRFKGAYDGTVSLPFDFTVRTNQIVIALTNVMNKEDVQRANRANATISEIDPFIASIPGMDCNS